MFYQQLKAKFEPYLHMSDGESEHDIFAHVFMTFPESRSILITGIDHFDIPVFV